MMAMVTKGGYETVDCVYIPVGSYLRGLCLIMYELYHFARVRSDWLANSKLG